MTDRILIVDDEPGILHALQRLLHYGLNTSEGRRYVVDECDNGFAALELAHRRSYALALCDYRMPGMSGVSVLSALRELQPDCGRIIVSGYADLQGLMGAVNDAAIARFVSKPWGDQELIGAVREVLRQRELAQENLRLADQVRCQRGQITPQEAERRRLEQLEPGITQVTWAEDGSFILEDPGELK